MAMEKFEGGTAVVTGGASGMGLAFAHRFAEAGMNVVVADIESEPLAMAEASIAAKGVKVMPVRTDVAKAADIAALADKSFERFGRVNVLCNNAGVAGSPGTAWELSQKDWEWVIDVDLWSVINGVRSFVPRMIASGEEGHIVNTASIAGLVSGLVGSPYHVAKFGVVALSEQLFFELNRAGHKIGVSVLCPGLVNTNIYDSGRNRQAEYGESASPAPDSRLMSAAIEGLRPTMLQPGDIAQMVFEAVSTKQLYIVPTGSESLDGALADRLENVMQRKNPSLAPTGLR
jgi:NAD(P)-dependent dehydrogenase (short-subunit alcohol dehydrogenase family)